MERGESSFFERFQAVIPLQLGKHGRVVSEQSPGHESKVAEPAFLEELLVIGSAASHRVDGGSPCGQLAAPGVLRGSGEIEAGEVGLEPGKVFRGSETRFAERPGAVRGEG